ncbi:biosynthesis-related protein [Kockovaella imperatae]|uniref:Glutamyl-tRNA(Gln) amidotransferase subunit B, mitochondrial n=1 Tax=Kockovaella imperatae TaxID=4999 RepID=A0A1Y1UJW0_9TREE|nr:biosynthesis-related protein [Kockovaella imperatae]ORX38272.1 biosynthesis-related protein [Kockovaella imperatae]
MRLLTPAWSCTQIRWTPIHHSPGRPSRRLFASSSTDSTPDSDDWETIIGLEIHAQIKTPHKLFSRASTSYADPPNANVELLDAAIPGTLPVLNRDAVRLALLTSIALKCDINKRSTFDRKHYFYHDIPASYQITQHYNPIARNGRLAIRDGDWGSQRAFNVGIQQLQIEQDTAKSQIMGSDRLIDLNRGGAGLMEIVTDPDMRSPEEAAAFVRKLQSVLRRIGSGDGDMEKGNLRIDANVSVNRPGEAWGTRCEIKNLNSLRFLQQAIKSERLRQIAHYTSQPGIPLQRETRGVNEVTGETYSLRSKEDAMDYRYMPDANLPAMVIDEAYLSKLRHEVPELPWETVDRMCTAYDVQKRDVETLIGLDEVNGQGLSYFEGVVQDDPSLGKPAMIWINHVLLGQLTKLGKTWSPEVIPFSLMRDLIQAVIDDKLTNEAGKQVVHHIIDQGHIADMSLGSVLKALNISTDVLSERALRMICIDVVRQLTPKDLAMRDKKGRLPIGMVIGKVMAQTKGQANAIQVKKILEELLKDFK